MKFYQSKNARIHLITLCSVIMLFTYACSGDTGYKHVDFSERVLVKRPAGQTADSFQLRVAVAAVISPKETFVYYRQLLDYIGHKLERKVQLIQRKTYSEINELFSKGQIDLAFICSGPYAVSKEIYGFEALATPIVLGIPFYHSYLIVNIDSPFQKIDDLRDQVFAFTDPKSNTGALVPTYWLAEMGERPDSFFSSVNYTYSHDNSIMAVARNLVDGATVDGHIWEYYNIRNPIYTSKTRVIKKSQPFGSPPLVSSVYLPVKLKEKIRNSLFTMHQDPDGRRILKELMIDRFVAPREIWYESVRNMEQKVEASKNKANATQNS
ncbi:MAG: phosphate/phosphite/phosphonate ABC transporter substrate-binding protein [Deltaproteobacteria bacterium]|nr:MAG: phosphate/phosphite/phosphonate ABC transporter substrate-binding protein [Deltaproteobacteria bacterium]